MRNMPRRFFEIFAFGIARNTRLFDIERGEKARTVFQQFFKHARTIIRRPLHRFERERNAVFFAKLPRCFQRRADFGKIVVQAASRIFFVARRAVKRIVLRAERVSGVHRFAEKIKRVFPRSFVFGKQLRFEIRCEKVDGIDGKIPLSFV